MSVVLVNASLLTGARAQLAGRSGAWQMELEWLGIRAEKTFEENGKKVGVLSSAMTTEQTENGENSTNSVSGKDDGLRY